MDYRYAFNGKEKDNAEEWGDGNHYDYGFRIYNPEIAKFLSVDPLSPEYPMLTPYQFAGNTPIQAIDLDGLEASVSTTPRENGTAVITITIDIEVIENSKQSSEQQSASNKLIANQTGRTFKGTDSNGNTYLTVVNYKPSASLKLEYTDKVVDKVTGIAYPDNTIGVVGDSKGNLIGDTQENKIQVLSGMNDRSTAKTGTHELGHLLGLRHPHRPSTAATATTPIIKQRGDPRAAEKEKASPENIMSQSSVTPGTTGKISQLENIVRAISLETGVYGIKKGDTLKGIATRFRTTEKRLRDLNKGLSELKAGQTIKLK